MSAASGREGGPDGGLDPARAEVAGMAAVIERAEADLSLLEEPARFAVALEAGAPDEAAPLPEVRPARACPARSS